MINADAGGWRLCIPCFFLSCFTLLAAQNTNWKQELRLAIRSNDVTEVAAILTSNSLPPGVTLDENSVTPLHLASLMGSREVASWLLDKGAPVDAATCVSPFVYNVQQEASWPALARRIIEKHVDSAAPR